MVIKRQSLLGPKGADSSQHQAKARKWWQQQDAAATPDDDTSTTRRASFGSYQPDESDLEQDWWDEQEYEAEADVAPEPPTEVMSLSAVLPAVASASGKSKQQLIHPAMERQHRPRRQKKKVGAGAHWWQQDYGFLPARTSDAAPSPAQAPVSEPVTTTTTTTSFTTDSSRASAPPVSRKQVALPAGVMRGSAFMAIKARAAESRGTAPVTHTTDTDAAEISTPLAIATPATAKQGETQSAAANTTSSTGTPAVASNAVIATATTTAHVTGAGAALAPHRTTSCAPAEMAPASAPAAAYNSMTNTSIAGYWDAAAFDAASDYIPEPPADLKAQWQEAEEYLDARDIAPAPAPAFASAPPESYAEAYSNDTTAEAGCSYASSATSAPYATSASDAVTADYSAETEFEPEPEPQSVAPRYSCSSRTYHTSRYGRSRRYQKAARHTAENEGAVEDKATRQQAKNSEPPQGPDNSVKNAVNEMLRLLTGREYSEQELRSKCKGRFTPEAIDAAMRYCQEHNYQSEERYGQMLVRHMEFTHSGPLKLRLKARQKGVDSELTSQLSAEVDWDELAYQALCKKYGVQVLDYATKRKALAYLGRRGFASSSCLNALQRLQQEAREALENEDSEA